MWNKNQKLVLICILNINPGGLWFNNFKYPPSHVDNRHNCAIKSLVCCCVSGAIWCIWLRNNLLFAYERAVPIFIIMIWLKSDTFFPMAKLCMESGLDNATSSNPGVFLFCSVGRLTINFSNVLSFFTVIPWLLGTECTTKRLSRSALNLLLPSFVDCYAVVRCLRPLLSSHAIVQLSTLLLPATFAANHQPLPSDSLVTTHRPPLLLPSLVSFFVIVPHLLLSSSCCCPPLTPSNGITHHNHSDN